MKSNHDVDLYLPGQHDEVSKSALTGATLENIDFKQLSTSNVNTGNQANPDSPLDQADQAKIINLFDKGLSLTQTKEVSSRDIALRDGGAFEAGSKLGRNGGPLSSGSPTGKVGFSSTPIS